VNTTPADLGSERLARSVVLNLADHRITIGGQDFPWYISEEGFAVETQVEETENTEALNVLHMRVLISGNVTIEGDPAPYPDYRQRYVIGAEETSDE